MLLQAVNFNSCCLIRRTLNDVKKTLHSLSRNGFWSWFFKFFFSVDLKIILGFGKCQILPRRVWLHCVLVDHKFPKCLNIFFLSSRKRQTTVRSFKIKTSWSSDASSTANTIVSSQVRTNCHPFIHSFLNLFILYGLMQKYLLSQLPCKSKV